MPLHVLLVFALLVGNVILRTFTNTLGILPKIFNLVDIPIVALLFVIYITSRRRGTYALPWTVSISRKTAGFCLVLLLGTALNFEFAYLPATMSQITMLLLPLVLFVALVNLPFTQDQVISYSSLLRKLIIFEVVIGVLQLPIRLHTGDSEAVHGTFPGNAEQYAAFLMIGVFYLIGLAVINPNKRKRYIAAVLLILVLNLSIDNKASWLGIVCSLGLVLWQLGTLKSRLVQTFGSVLLICGLGIVVGFVASKTSNTLYKFELLAAAVREGKIGNLGKVKAYLDIARSHLTHPHMLLVGAGPSNFYSRGSRQFYLSQRLRSKMYSNPDSLHSETVHLDSGRISDSMGGAIAATTRAPYYDKFYGDRDLIYAVGSIQVDSPFSPYAGLLGETGLIGTWLYLSIYLLVLRRLLVWLPAYRDDPHISPLLITSLGFLIYMMVNSVYGPFMETTRLTSILWSMVALVALYIQRQEEHEFDTEEAGRADSETMASRQPSFT